MFTGQFDVISNRATWLSPVVEAIDEATNDQQDLSDAGLVVDVSVTIRSLDRCNTFATATIANGKAALTAPAPAGIQWQFEVSDLCGLHAGTYLLGVKLTINGFVTDLIDAELGVVEGN